METEKCPNCGGELQDGKCPNCSATTPEQAPEQVPEQAPVAEEPVQ